VLTALVIVLHVQTQHTAQAAKRLSLCNQMAPAQASAKSMALNGTLILSHALLLFP